VLAKQRYISVYVLSEFRKTPLRNVDVTATDRRGKRTGQRKHIVDELESDDISASTAGRP
jgi:hypothetical protein